MLDCSYATRAGRGRRSREQRVTFATRLQPTGLQFPFLPLVMVPFLHLGYITTIPPSYWMWIVFSLATTSRDAYLPGKPIRFLNRNLRRTLLLPAIPITSQFLTTRHAVDTLFPFLLITYGCDVITYSTM